VALGNMANTALLAAEELGRAGIAATVAVVSSFNPSPSSDLSELLSRVPLALSVEAHYLTGGLGSFVAEVIAENGLECRLVRNGIEEMPRGMTGSPGYLYERCGLSPAQIAERAAKIMGLVQR